MTLFRKTFLAIALPVAVQYLLRSSLNLIDTIMVGQLGDLAIASVGIANQIYFVMNLFILGITSGIGIFIAQFFGKRDVENIKRMTAIGIIATTFMTLLFMVISLNGYHGMMAIFSKDFMVIEMGGTYLKIVAWSYVVTGITAVFSTVTRATGKAKIPLVASITGILFNTIGNYCLIFIAGLGVKGAAIATVIARFVECSILLIAIYKYHPVVLFQWRHVTQISMIMVKQFFKESVILIIKDASWGIGMALYMVIYAQMGTAVVASINIISTIRSLAFVLMAGISSASAVIIGQALGADYNEEAFQISKTVRKITVIVAGISAILVIIIKPFILSFFNVSDLVHMQADQMLWVFALFLIFESYSMISVMGILRSGADNKFCMYMDFIAIWGLGLPMAYIGGIVLKLPVMVVYALALCPELFKNVILSWRIRSRKWIKNVVDDL